VLLAEDDDDLREVMMISLGEMGYSVTGCSDANLASKAFRGDARIDILMTDLEMPGRSGLELARELTALKPSLAVMIVSGALITPMISAEIKERNWRYIPKPCGLPKILDVLESLLPKQPEGRPS
jgi:two-component system chemotaxis response regulator CheY